MDLHDRVYQAEYGAGDRWAQTIRSAIERVVERAWPRESALGSVWLVQRDDRLVGLLALVMKCPRRQPRLVRARCRPHGRGLGRQLVFDLVAEPRARGMEKLKVQTFTKLTAAARLYRAAGFSVVRQQETDWHGERVIHQLYELTLDSAMTP